MKLLYTTKKFIFDSPEVMKDKMIEYLNFTEEQNADYTQRFCKNCGTLLKSATEKCCDSPNVEFKLVHKPTYEHMRPTLYGFAAFCGMGSTTIYKYTDRDGFPEVIDWFKNVLQMDLEQLLLNPFNRNVGGAKFVAVNNFGWKDKTDIEHTGVQSVQFIDDISSTRVRDSILAEPVETIQLDHIPSGTPDDYLK